MHNNNFTIALRQLRKQKMYAAIKIGGLALGITACLLISLYIRDELSYDRSYPDTDRIFRLTDQFNMNGEIGTSASWPFPMAKALMTDFPEVEKAGRYMPHEGFDGAGSNEIRRADQLQNNYETRFTFADQGQHFAYRITISWWIFALAGIGAILIALLTVAAQAVKAALTNPVKSLRSE